MRLRRASLALAVFFSNPLMFAQQSVTIPLPGQRAAIKADLYGDGTKWVILAHGGRLTKESWKPQAEVLAQAGLAALAIQFRGDSFNADGSPSSAGSPGENAEDVLAAVQYLQGKAATEIDAIGASLGGDAVGDASGQSRIPLFSRIVILASSGGSEPEKLKGRKLFIVAHDDASGSGLRLPGIQRGFDRVPDPKKLVVVKGSAHAQFLFNTDQGSFVMNRILDFLTER
jgi:dienelactone hydrolase